MVCLAFLLRCTSRIDEAYSIASDGVGYEQDPATSSSHRAEPILSVIFPVVEPLEAGSVIEDQSRVGEINAMLFQVRFGLGSVPFEALHENSLRQCRRPFKNGHVNDVAHRLRAYRNAIQSPVTSTNRIPAHSL